MHLTSPLDLNTMDTTASAARKATTEEEKCQYQEKGCCFECSKQGHLARTCPDKKTQVCATNTDTTTSEAPPKTIAMTSQISASDITVRVIKMTDDKKAELVQVMRAAGEDAGFKEA